MQNTHSYRTLLEQSFADTSVMPLLATATAFIVAMVALIYAYGTAL